MNNQEIKQAPASDNKAERGHSDPDPQSPQVYKPRPWIAALVTSVLAVVGAGGFAWLFWASQAFSDVADGVKFITEGSIALALLLVAIVQACVYWSQRGVMQKQSTAMQDGLIRTDKVIEKMQGQWTAMGEQIKISRHQADFMKLQTDAMLRQVDALLSHGITMEGALKAARESVDVAWEGLKTEKRAYLGIGRMNIDLKEKKRLWVHLTNTGKTPASKIKANVSVTISTPMHWHEKQPANVRNFAGENEDYDFNLTEIYPSSIPAQIGFPLGLHFSEEELTLVAQKESHLTVSIGLDYWNGFVQDFSYYVLTYRGKDTHGQDSWGIFPTASEKQYDGANPDRRDFKVL